MNAVPLSLSNDFTDYQSNNATFEMTHPLSEKKSFSQRLHKPPVALTIAGSDSGGGAGIQADLFTFADLKVWGTSVITAITAQNPESIIGVEPVSSTVISQQAEQVYQFFSPNVLKTGLLPNEAAVAAVVTFLNSHSNVQAVIDPVMVATSGTTFLDQATITVLKEALLPRASLITPNLDEVNALLGWTPNNREGMVQAAKEILQAYGRAVLIKGGHLPEDKLVDVLLEEDHKLSFFEAERVPEINTHGSGCIFSSAITAFLAQEVDLKTAVSQAHAYLQRRIRQPVLLGRGAFIGYDE